MDKSEINKEWISKEKIRLTSEISAHSIEIERLIYLKNHKEALLLTASNLDAEIIQDVERLSVKMRGHSLFNSYMPIIKF